MMRFFALVLASIPAIVHAAEAVEEKTFDRAPLEIIDRLQHADGRVMIEKENWVDRFHCQLAISDGHGRRAAVSVDALAPRRTQVRASCLSEGVEPRACVAQVWTEIDPLLHKIYDAPAGPPERKRPLRLRGAFYGGALLGQAHVTATEINLGGMTYGNVDEYTDGAAFAGADFEKSWDYFGVVLGVGVVHQRALHAYTTMLPIATLARLRLPLPKCDFDQSGCMSLTLSAGPLFWFGSVMGGGAAGVGVEGRFGLEWQMSRHLGGMFELQGLTGHAGTSDRHFETPSAAFVAGVTLR